jgi:soluble lytic murein transglycosylase
MSNKPFIFWCLYLCSATILAESGKAYLEKFNTYTTWCQQLPRSPDPQFDAFIEPTSPLTKKLREKWLYQLARNKDWPTFTQYYRGSEDNDLQCYAQTALYHQGQHQMAAAGVLKLWLNGSSQPRACDELFTLLLKNNELSNTLILKRINLALEKRNVSLARYLLKQLQPPQPQEADLLTAISQNPLRILQLQPSQLHGEFYLYGLKLLVARDMNQGLRVWESPRSKIVMHDAQQQAFFAHIALYKSMRGQPDAALWFAKIKPNFYSDVLLDWQIRSALAQQKWHKVVYLIEHSKASAEPVWQYWKARALAAIGKKAQANELYQNLAEKRNYYGFLASQRLNKKFSFEYEPISTNAALLSPYQPILDEIKNLYGTHQKLAASRLLNDFVSELPKNEKSALANWVAHDLHWYGKSIYLSNNEDLNNQLALRFPLTHHEIIQPYARNYQIASEFVYAIIRQESSFYDDIVSSAGANGLMQIMPATAKAVAKRANIPYSDRKQLFSTQQNIHIGIAYLQQLSKQFHQHPVLVAAAYNAGPRQVNYWLKNHTPNDIDIWIDTLPWNETRDYLKNVIAFYIVYQYRLQIKPNLSEFMQPLRIVL